jgi:hypothetical protein
MLQLAEEAKFSSTLDHALRLFVRVSSEPGLVCRVWNGKKKERGKSKAGEGFPKHVDVA